MQRTVVEKMALMKAIPRKWMGKERTQRERIRMQRQRVARLETCG
jgi:hypothetical protein